MSSEKKLMNEETIDKAIALKWATLFHCGLYVGVSAYLSRFGWILYSLNDDYKVLGLIALLYGLAFIGCLSEYKKYKMESGFKW